MCYNILKQTLIFYKIEIVKNDVAAKRNSGTYIRRRCKSKNEGGDKK